MLFLGATANCEEGSRPGLPEGKIEWRSTYPVTSSSAGGQAQMCATGPFSGYTAAHVVDHLGEDMEWHYGVTKGRLKVTTRFKNRDLVAVISDSPFPYFSPLAVEGPPITSRVYIGGMLWFRRSLPIAYVTYSMGLDHEDDLISQGPSMQGSSGACEWAEDGTVVAIHTAYVGYRTEGRPPIDLAIGEPVWRGWREGR
jgi:hypothetical protein